MRRLIALGAVLVGVSAFLAPAIAGPHASMHLVTLVADRTTAGPTSFNVGFGLSWHQGGGGFFGDLGVRTAGSRVHEMLPDGMTSFGYGENETVSSHGSTVVSACRDVSTVTCVSAGPGSVGGGAVDYTDTGLQPGVANHWVFVLTPNVHITFHAKGWVLHRLDTAARVVTDTQADDYEVNVLARSVSAFSSASAPGGSRGSMAEAVPPCSNADVAPAREGVGSITLAGGVDTPQESCPGIAFGQAIGSWSPKATTWQVTGDVVGVSTLYNARLLVVDLPRSWSVTSR